MNYHVADFIQRIKNAYAARRQEVVMPYSNINLAIGKVLQKQGFLAQVSEEVIDTHRSIKVALRYERRKPVMHNVKIVSKPSLRVYIDAKMLPKLGNAITAVISTSSGVMTGKEAYKKGIGGELLFKIW